MSFPTGIPRHFYLDTIHMKPGFGNFNFIIQATCSASEWNEARAMWNNDSLAVVTFLFENVFCQFGGILFFTMDGSSKFKGFVQLFVPNVIIGCN